MADRRRKGLHIMYRGSILHVSSWGRLALGLCLLVGLCLALGGQEGGGIYNDGTMSISNSTLSHNSAYQGGGIYDYAPDGGGTLTITNSTFANNTATSGIGGGIYSEEGTVSITNSTFVNNSAS